MNFRKTILLILAMCILFGCSIETDRKEHSFLDALSTEKVSDTFTLKAIAFTAQSISEQRSIDPSYTNLVFSFVAVDSSKSRPTEQQLTTLSKLLPSNVFYSDEQIASTAFIRNHIYKSIEGYRQSRWSTIENYDLFLQFVLPYKLGNETNEDWIAKVHKAFPTINPDSLSKLPVLEAARILHKLMYEKKGGFVLSGLQLSDLPYSVHERLMTGTCHELAQYGVKVMRAYSIPCAIDFTPQYANRSGGHKWCSVIVRKDSCIGFDVTSDSLGYNKYWDPRTRFAKVFRKTFTPQNNTHFSLAGYKGNLPDVFNEANILDVTNLYTGVKNISIPLTEPMTQKPPHLVYLSVFDNQNWTPVTWGLVEESYGKFEQIGTDAVYMAEYIDEFNKKCASWPFIVRNGKPELFLIPDTTKFSTVTLTRKYPITSRIELYISRMIGGEFQGSNFEDFTDADVLYKINSLNGDHFNTVNLNVKKKYRFIRYHSPNNGYGNVAELQFFGNNLNEPLTGKIMGTTETYQNNNRFSREKVFDNNPLTYFDGKNADSTWVGLDLGTPQKIQKIKFLSRNDLNGIYPGDNYQLLYWNQKWVSIASKVAFKDDVTFEQVPLNSLLLLRNLTTGKEERIFTMDGNTQLWW